MKSTPPRSPAQTDAPPASPLLAVADGADLNELAAWTTVARVLLNLDETMTKE